MGWYNQPIYGNDAKLIAMGFQCKAVISWENNGFHLPKKMANISILLGIWLGSHRYVADGSSIGFQRKSPAIWDKKRGAPGVWDWCGL